MALARGEADTTGGRLPSECGGEAPRASGEEGLLASVLGGGKLVTKLSCRRTGGRRSEAVALARSEEDTT